MQCKDPKGSIFCDGQWVDSGGNLEACANALNAILNLKFSSSASAECVGNTCSAEAKASASACSTTTPDSPNAPLAPAAIAMCAVGAVLARRVRRGGR